MLSVASQASAWRLRSGGGAGKPGRVLPQAAAERSPLASYLFSKGFFCPLSSLFSK